MSIFSSRVTQCGWLVDHDFSHQNCWFLGVLYTLVSHSPTTTYPGPTLFVTYEWSCVARGTGKVERPPHNMRGDSVADATPSSW